MSIPTTSRISLEQARSLVDLLESGKQKEADAIISGIQSPINSELFAEIGKLTRQLHDSLTNFQVDSRLNDLAKADIPDAKERLNYVITRTEEAANKTMDAVEAIFPVVDTISDQVAAVNPSWTKLMNNELNLTEFKSLCLDIDTLLKNTGKETRHIHDLMTDVLMAQDFQDLTGQVIRKVIELVIEVEESLINMLTAFGLSTELAKDKETPKVGENLVEGPIVDTKKRDDVVEDQDDVDDLLSSLGF
ncbi:protein phosphatase CheZ [Colwellia sp. E2M01]|uniref:protein phosphatase CheZ n=1 Tax=Colwellia sp. E2M01 TaxID=2841561 RepID=UPI001C09B10E|nr:protein phosphatase CheZ [Colwellia sp. E2M01]MBU2869935.1 protein phosphatase CheZ [Colwellia sp. E2M01]